MFWCHFAANASGNQLHNEGSIKCKQTVRWQHFSQMKIRSVQWTSSNFLPIKMQQAQSGAARIWNLTELHWKMSSLLFKTIMIWVYEKSIIWLLLGNFDCKAWLTKCFSELNAKSMKSWDNEMPLAIKCLVDEMPGRWNALVGEFSHRLKKRVRWNAINAKKKSFSKVFPFFVDVWCCCCCYCYFCCCYCCCLLMLLPPLF